MDYSIPGRYPQRVQRVRVWHPVDIVQNLFLRKEATGEVWCPRRLRRPGEMKFTPCRVHLGKHRDLGKNMRNILKENTWKYWDTVPVSYSFRGFNV